MSFVVYVLRSESSGRLYVGHTQDLERRLGELVVNFAGGIAIGHVLEPNLLEGVLLAASWGASVGLGFHFGHNWQQSQRWDYFGSIDGSDQMANAIGPRLVVVGAVGASVCLFYLTYQALR